MDTEFISLLDKEISIKVSSFLEKSTGKKNLIDNNPETCWTSQQGLPQFIQLGFPSRVVPKRLSIVFQGGFVGTRCAVCIPGTDSNKNWQIICYVYPEDVNRRQSFDLVPAQPELLEGGVSFVRLVFEESSDFFGRITVYDMKLEGTLA
ncbi:galactose-binding like protein [Phlegmacium glaucopus]|nr:galactose-binding like protein [Phlegmacium glaucopus]